MPLTAKEQKKAAHERAGDWVCKRCNNHNFSFRSNCNMCHLSHDASVKMHYMMNNSSQPIKEASVPSSATGYNSVSKLPSNNSSSALVPNPFMNQLQSTMRERVVHVHQYFNTYQVQPQAYVQSSLPPAAQTPAIANTPATTTQAQSAQPSAFTSISTGQPMPQWRPTANDSTPTGTQWQVPK